MADHINLYIRRRSRSEALRVLGLDEPGSVVIRVVFLCGYVLAVWWLFTQNEATNEAWLKVAAMVTPLLSLPVVYLWRKDRVQKEMIERTARQVMALKSAAKARPSLKISVDSVAYGGDMVGNKHVGLLLFLLSVRNLGDKPSAAMLWKCSFQVGGETIIIAPMEVPYITLGNKDGPDITLLAKDAIYHKTFSAIPGGGVTTGFFACPLPREITDQLGKDTEFTIRCEQTDGTEVSTTHTLGTGIAGPLGIVPGIDFQFGEGTAR
jgi:hypothetical protein